MMDRHHEGEAEEGVVEEEEIKAEEKPKLVMIKSKKIQESLLTNQKFSAIIEETSLFMTYTEDILLQGSQEVNLTKNLWYLDTGASSHITRKKSFFYSLDKNQ